VPPVPEGGKEGGRRGGRESDRFEVGTRLVTVKREKESAEGGRKDAGEEGIEGRGRGRGGVGGRREARGKGRREAKA
jgi:hypothetical protein